MDAETRERLCALRELQENLTTTRSQVAGVCIQWESLLGSEDWKLLNSAREVSEVLTSLEQQQQHYAQLSPDLLNPESSIPIIFSRVGEKISRLIDSSFDINDFFQSYRTTESTLVRRSKCEWLYSVLTVLGRLVFYLH